MKQIAVVGAGTMGNGIAHVFALHEYQVALIDLSEDRLKLALSNITANLERMAARQLIDSKAVSETLDRIVTVTSLQLGLAKAELIIEAATENVALKKDLFQQIDALAPKSAILATNTSSISITELAAVTRRPEKVIGMHFMNPVPIMKLVEVITGYNTSVSVAQTITELAKALGKIPTTVKDYPGFVANRILMPMINEAVETLFQGIGGVAEIDAIMKLGMGHPMGPLELADFIGLDVCLAILEVMYDGFKNPKYAPCPLLVQMVASGNLGIKSGTGFYDYSQSRKATQVATNFCP